MSNLGISAFQLPRWKKRFLMLLVDLILIPTAWWFSYVVLQGTLFPEFSSSFLLLVIAPLLSIPIFIRLGLYKAIIRYMGGKAMFSILKGAILSTVILVLSTFLIQAQGVESSNFIIYLGTLFFLVGGSRYMVRYYYHSTKKYENRKNVIVYGAGSAGRQLATSLVNGSEFLPVAFVDDDIALHNSSLQGVKVYSVEDMPKLIGSMQVEQILLAMPSIGVARKREILNELEHLPIQVRTTPCISDLLLGKYRIDHLVDFNLDELLGREPVKPNYGLMTNCIQYKNIMVTGAGGSIGSELCRQIIRLAPNKLILFESSEFALYQIERELLDLSQKNNLEVQLIAVLGSVQDYARVECVLTRYEVKTLYHAAAYKHVPLVEHNPIEGIRNNVLGTFNAAKAARAVGVRHFILISTDKAVRPTNVMGASKRLAELVLQGLAQEPRETIFSMVRFGNVLGSSGSVIPLFRRQIAEGGAITVTHPEIIRYFMTIPEAAQLVIQAGAMSQGGEVFLLDMGEPVRILDLAKRMVHLAGLEVKDSDNPRGNIAIKFTGLRPGEKLYEELLLDDSPEKTDHKRIFKAHETALSLKEVHDMLRSLRSVCDRRDEMQIYSLLKVYVQGYSNEEFELKAKQNSSKVEHNYSALPLGMAIK